MKDGEDTREGFAQRHHSREPTSLTATGVQFLSPSTGAVMQLLRRISSRKFSRLSIKLGAL